jgi:hypothetical protein
MAIEVQGKVGPQSLGQSLGDGSLVVPYLGKQAQTIVQDFAPRYTEVGYRGLSFCACNQASQAISNLSTTQTGFLLINPLGSGRVFWLLDIIIAESSAIGSVVPAVGLAANTTPAALTAYTLSAANALTVQPTLIGGPAVSAAKVYLSSTLPVAPVYVRSIWGGLDLGTAPTSGAPNPYVKDEVAGAIGITPGCSVSLTSTAAISAIASMTWLELPL